MMTRKTLTLLLISCLFSIGNAQQDPEFKVFFYFEDSKGNKDTVLIGYDDGVMRDNSGNMVDWMYGETLDTVAFDSVFEVKVAPFLDGPRNYQYKNYRLFEPLILPTHYVDGCLFPEGVNFFVQTKNFPITVTWDFQFTSPCIDGTFLTPDFLYHQLNPVYWMQEEWARFCCLESSLEYKIDLTKGYRHPDSLGERTIFIERPIVGSLNEKDTIWGLNLVYMPANMYSPCSIVNVDDPIKFNKIHTYPIPANDYVIFYSDEIIDEVILDIYFQSGQFIETVSLFPGLEKRLDLSFCKPGYYFYMARSKDIFFHSGMFLKI